MSVCPQARTLYVSKRAEMVMVHATEKQKLRSYLFQTSTLGANKSYAVAIVDVGGDGSHAVPSLGVERVTRHQLRPSEGLIDVQATERVINGHRLPGRAGRGQKRGRKDHFSYGIL